MKLPDIKRHDILVFRNLVSDKLAPSTTNTLMSHLAGILSRAHDEGRIPIYPMKKIGLLESDSEPLDPFSFDELNTFLDFLYENNYPEADMIFVWSRCGFRHGEILALKWDDIDFYNRQINIKRTILQNGSEGIPKTKCSIRTVKILSEAFAALKRQEALSKMAGEYVFPDPLTRQRYTREKVFWKRFRFLLQLAGLKYRSPNQLRHTFVTLAISSGENITWVSKTVGHSDVTTTLKRYNRFIPDLTRDDGSALEKALKKRQNGDILATFKVK
jgi:integrase